MEVVQMKRFLPLVAALAILFMSAVAFAGEWTGTVEKQDGKLWFKSGDNVLSITNPEKAEAFVDQTVKVTGEADMTAKTVTIESVAAAS